MSDEERDIDVEDVSSNKKTYFDLIWFDSVSAEPRPIYDNYESSPVSRQSTQLFNLTLAFRN